LMALLGISAGLALLLNQVNASLAAPLVRLTSALNWLMVHSVDPFERLGIASIRLPEYSGWTAAVYFIYFIPLALLVYRLWFWNPFASSSTRSRNAVTVLAVVQLLFCFLIVLHPFSAGFAKGRLRIDFLDVGQGDAALVTMPDGMTLLIDGGGRPSFRADKRTAGDNDQMDAPFVRDTRSIGERVVSEYLWWRGLDRVDYILATHADADHIDGLNDVARNFRVRTAFVARTPSRDPEYEVFSETLRAQHVPLSLIGAGDELSFETVSAGVVWPPLSPNSDAPSRNNESIVLALRFGARTILMTGDVEKAGEAAILRSGIELDAAVVKVPHHGSKTSSTPEFVLATHPLFAIISVGTRSQFGHPRPEVVERWRASGAQVLTTGKSGTITITTNGADLTIASFVK